jgi:hypothetical protein
MDNNVIYMRIFQKGRAIFSDDGVDTFLPIPLWSQDGSKFESFVYTLDPKNVLRLKRAGVAKVQNFLNKAENRNRDIVNAVGTKTGAFGHWYTAEKFKIFSQDLEDDRKEEVVIDLDPKENPKPGEVIDNNDDHQEYESDDDESEQDDVDEVPTAEQVRRKSSYKPDGEAWGDIPSDDEATDPPLNEPKVDYKGALLRGTRIARHPRRQIPIRTPSPPHHVTPEMENRGFRGGRGRGSGGSRAHSTTPIGPEIGGHRGFRGGGTRGRGNGRGRGGRMKFESNAGEDSVIFIL